MKITPSGHTHFLIEENEMEALGHAAGNTPPARFKAFHVKVLDFGLACVEQVTRHQRQDHLFTIPSDHIVTLNANLSMTVEKRFPPLQTTLLVSHGYGERWEDTWAPLIETYEAIEGELIPRIRVTLPRRIWRATMPVSDWGKGFTSPTLECFRENDVTYDYVLRWLGGNVDSGFSICWGDADQIVRKPFATLDSFDEVFFKTVFNTDLQRDYQKWTCFPSAFGYKYPDNRLGPDAFVIPRESEYLEEFFNDAYRDEEEEDEPDPEPDDEPEEPEDE